MGFLLFLFKFIWGTLSFAFGAVGFFVSLVLGIMGAILSGVFAIFFVPIVILAVIGLVSRRHG